MLVFVSNFFVILCLTVPAMPPHLQKRSRGEDGQEGEDLINVLRAVGEAGKGFVRSVHLLKYPKVVA